MARIEIYGPIWWMGMANAESVCAAINSASESLDIRLDSPGGDIMEQLRMSAAIAAWVIAHPGAEATITIDGMAASAAANLVALAPASIQVRCYAQSVVMYHSAAGAIFGGPDALRDSAKFLEAYNRQVIAALAAKTGMSAADVSPWFAEGREEWILGDRAGRIGLATLISGEPETHEYKLDDGNAQMVALVGKIIKRKGLVMAEECKRKPVAADDDIREDVDERDRLERENRDETDELKRVDEEIKNKTDERERVDEEIKNKTDERERVDEELKNKTEERERVENENEELRKRLDNLETRISELAAAIEGKRAALALPALKPGEHAHVASGHDFAALVRGIPMGLSASQYAAQVEKLKVDYPVEYKAFVEKNSKRLI